MEIEIRISKQAVIDWLNEDAEDAERHAQQYAQAVAEGMEAAQNAVVTVELTDIYDHKIYVETDELDGEDYERLIDAIETNYQDVCAELSDFSWISD